MTPSPPTGYPKANLHGLLLVLGRESTGAITLLPEGTLPKQIPDSQREVARQQLAERLRSALNALVSRSSRYSRTF